MAWIHDKERDMLWDVDDTKLDTFLSQDRYELAEAPSEAPKVEATPAAVEHAEATGVDLTQVEGSGADGRITKADVQAAASEQPTE